MAEANAIDMVGAPNPKIQKTGKKQGKKVRKRLKQELAQLMMGGNDDISAFPNGDNLFEWTCSIVGPEGTVYAGLKYTLSMKFPDEYPYNAPLVKFVTPCFHPNVDEHGNICLDILKEKWSAAYSVTTVLISLQSLLGEPNNDSPLNNTAAELWDRQIEYKAILLKKYAEDAKKSS
mmetsp:Transcript_2424/g.3609  ORF Transcript_2424/g.3609 Transcript_2424/m.3609 type:complete len:176 (-) Transcript_2424:243-770(-)|eukprot:CAMPEP_0195521636 /NCGR_PEP_ID=MMETSP0794_2-20130614/19094_1 /TAXON_ID=515487 /ORGANISM="Stephanopyxis turris, Strain CCMP 815" /LENGTH=175 /DNA_ID=CAMNT_0040651237 /DNA_START=125 /DNA_END=652 /DNA_ORIENTATION=+